MLNRFSYSLCVGQKAVFHWCHSAPIKARLPRGVDAIVKISLEKPYARGLRKSSILRHPFSINYIMKHSFTVCVEGNIASGKTKLLEYFKKFSGIVEVLEEPTQKWRNIQGHNALAKMYEDPVRWGAIFQSYSQLTMTDLHTRPQICPVKMMERSLYSGRYCFIENLHRSKDMPGLDYVVLTQWFDWLVKSNDIKVDLVVYLRTRPEVVLERVKARLRPEEQCIPLKYLEDLHDLHEEWLIKKTTYQPPAPVLVLDANQDLPSMYELFEKEKAKILFGLAPS